MVIGWPGLATNYAASLAGAFLGFVLAIAVAGWQLRQAQTRAEEDELARLRTEARRRFSILSSELSSLHSTIESIRSGSTPTTIRLAKHLSDWRLGWLAGAIGALCRDYQLVADLGSFYGRVEHFQWVVRLLAEGRFSSDLRSRLSFTRSC